MVNLLNMKLNTLSPLKAKPKEWVSYLKMYKLQKSAFISKEPMQS